MTAKNRDQPRPDLVQQYLPGLILNTIPGIIHELGDPYDVKPGLGGMAAYPPMAMVAVCVMPGAERTTYPQDGGHAQEQPRHGNQDGADKNPPGVSLLEPQNAKYKHLFAV